jgi:hypothetical protein
MANYTLKVPAAELTAPDNWGSRESIKSMLQRIWDNYWTYIKEAAKNSKIPAPIITSFIAVESGGNPYAGPDGHITQGLMQWNRKYAKATLERELSKGRMSDGEKQILAKYGIKFDAAGKTREITNADQKKPELNIVIGTILLGQLIDEPWGTDADGLHLDRIISVYNAGAYGETGKKARQLTSPKHDTPQKLSSNVNPITSAYIKKILGKNGTLDIITSDFKNVITD